MKNKVIFTIAILMTIFVGTSFGQHDAMGKKDKMKKETMIKKGADEASVIKLEQTKGQFTIQALTLSEGTYVFEIANNGVDHEVGFVIAPKSNPDQHIKTGYVKETVKNGKSSTSNVVKLAKGEYVYFCPMNPTPQYSITVK